MKESLVVDGHSDTSPAQLDAARAAFPKVGQNLMNAEKARATAAIAYVSLVLALLRMRHVYRN